MEFQPLHHFLTRPTPPRLPKQSCGDASWGGSGSGGAGGGGGHTDDSDSHDDIWMPRALHLPRDSLCAQIIICANFVTCTLF